MSKVATRFAPSPTGTACTSVVVRTALFNWLFSKNQKGSFYLRIEDTDKERSKDEYKKQIIHSLKWIGIEHDGKWIYSITKNKWTQKGCTKNLLRKRLCIQMLLFWMKRSMNRKIDAKQKRNTFCTIH